MQQVAKKGEENQKVGLKSIEKPKTDKQLAQELYTKTLSKIRDAIKAANSKHKFTENDTASGQSIFGPERTRLLKLVKTRTGFILELNVEVKPVEGLKVLTPEEAKQKHMGTCRWIYTGSDEKVIKNLVMEAVNNFIPVPKQSIGTKKTEKAVEKAAEKGKTDPVKNEEKSSEVKTYRLSQEELDKIKTTKPDKFVK